MSAPTTKNELFWYNAGRFDVLMERCEKLREAGSLDAAVTAFEQAESVAREIHTANRAAYYELHPEEAH